MKLPIFVAAVAALSCASPLPAIAAAPGKAIVSLYHVAPGQQVGFLKWLDQQDRVSVAAGVPKAALYVHTDGDSWDYMVLYPMTTKAQDDATEAVGKRMGINMMKGGLELRKYLSSHTDTFVNGPMSAADYLAMVGEK